MTIIIANYAPLTLKDILQFLITHSDVKSQKKTN